MSSDRNWDWRLDRAADVSIPLEQGNVFRHSLEDVIEEKNKSQSLWNRAMSSDTEGFGVFRVARSVSIPLEQGNVFRPTLYRVTIEELLSQSLWNRAMSSDGSGAVMLNLQHKSQSLWNRAMSSDAAVKFIGFDSMDVSIPLEQGNVFRQ